MKQENVERARSVILKKIIMAMLIVLALFALWTSIHETFAIWTVNADTVDMALLFHGFQNHGISFLKTWRYTQDNWLLSAGPLSFIIYYFFGVNDYTIIGSGWFILVFNAFLGGYILYKLTKYQSIYPSLFFLLACLFPSLGALGGNGFMAFFLSHNSTMSIVLVSFFTLLTALQKEKQTLISISMFLLSLLVFVGGISDPWFNAAFTVPAIISLSLLALSKKNIFVVYVSLFYIAVGFILAQTKLFGELSFLPSTSYIFVTSLDQFGKNVHFLISSLSTFSNAHELLKINILLGYLYIIGVFYVVFRSFYFLLKNYRIAESTEKLFINFSVFSITTMVAAFVLSNFPGGYYSGRFLVNIFYMLFMVVIYSYYSEHKESYYRLIVPLSLLFLYSLSSVYQGEPYWRQIKLINNQLSSISLINFLERHNLHYGYGGYWAADANAISVISGYHVLIRPVSYEPIYKKGSDGNFPFAYIVGNHPQSSPFWYHKNNIKKYKSSFLVIADGGAPELYRNNVKQSEKIAIEQFGLPDRSYKFDKKTILVWNKDINVSTYGERSERYDYTITALISAYKCLLDKNKRSDLYPLIAENKGCLNSYFGGFKKDKSNFNWTAMSQSAWLGYLGEKRIGVGVNISFTNIRQTKEYLSNIRHKYRGIALIYFPYPKKLISISSVKNSDGLLMLKFYD
jgi:hypothetical protein